MILWTLIHFFTGKMLVNMMNQVQAVSSFILDLIKLLMILIHIVTSYFNSDIYSYCYYNDSFAMGNNK